MIIIQKKQEGNGGEEKFSGRSGISVCSVNTWTDMRRREKKLTLVHSGGRGKYTRGDKKYCKGSSRKT